MLEVKKSDKVRKTLSMTIDGDSIMSSPRYMTNPMEIIIHVLRKNELERSDADIDKLLEQLEDNDFFSALKLKRPYEVSIELGKKLQYEHFKAGQYIFRKDDKGDKFYIVLEGRVAVENPVNPAKHQGKKSVKVSKLGAGASFGELALITDGRRSMGVRCMEDTHLAILNNANYQKIFGY